MTLTTGARQPNTVYKGNASVRVNRHDPIRIILAEDHTIVRQGLRNLLQTEPNFEIVGEADTGRQALALTLELKPHVVLMDLAMPALNGLEATRQIVRELPETKVIVLSSYTDDDYVTGVLAAGASGYLSKQTAAADVADAIRAARSGKTVFSSEIAKRLRDKNSHGHPIVPQGPAAPGIRHTLTSRELEVLQLIAEGYANKQIAAELAISIKTVEKHRQRIMDKLDIHQTAGLTRYAIEKGIIQTRPAALATPS